MKHFMLYYNLIPDRLTLRVAYKDEHIRRLDEFSKRGLLFVGVEKAGDTQGVFMFEGENDDIVKEWLATDPYIRNGVVEQYHTAEIRLVGGQIFNQTLS